MHIYIYTYIYIYLYIYTYFAQDRLYACMSLDVHTVVGSAYLSQCCTTAMPLPEGRLAADGAAYTYADFEQWDGAPARQTREGAAATEHSQNQWRLAVDGAAYTYADFEQWYGEHAGRMWEGAAATEHSGYGADAAELWERAAATEHSGSTGLQASSSGSEAPHPAGATVCAGALPRNASLISAV